MHDRRLRIFAGPNGSGKSTLKNKLPSHIIVENYINADDIEQHVNDSKPIMLNLFGVAADTAKLYHFFDDSSFVKDRSNAVLLKSLFKIENNVLLSTMRKDINAGYASAIIAEFIRAENLKKGNSFSFETVMSHFNKIELMKAAIEAGYKVYLYYVCTDDFKVNIERVKLRAAKGGHDVSVEKIKSRYLKSLENLKEAMLASYKAYLFDNSLTNKGGTMREVARMDRNQQVYIQMPENELPNWFIKYVINKQQ